LQEQFEDTKGVIRSRKFALQKCTKPGNGAVMCFRDFNFASVSTNVLLNLGTVLTLRYLFGFPFISHN